MKEIATILGYCVLGFVCAAGIVGAARTIGLLMVSCCERVVQWKHKEYND